MTSGPTPSGPESPEPHNQESIFDRNPPIAQYQPPSQSNRLPGWAKVVMILGAILIIALLAALGAKNDTSTGASSTSSGSYSLPVGALGVMPDYRGQNAGAAAADLQRFGVYLSFNQAQAAGVVGNQTPAPGTVIYRGTSVVLYPYSMTTSAAAPLNPNGPFSSGTYLVNEEISPGSYRTDGTGTSCYWARLRDTSGDFSAIIANGNAAGPTTVTVSASDGAVTFRGDCSWARRS